MVLSAAGTDHVLPADQALVAAAVTTSAEVRVALSSTLGTPVAALLRWDQDAVNAPAERVRRRQRGSPGPHQDHDEVLR